MIFLVAFDTGSCPSSSSSGRISNRNCRPGVGTMRAGRDTIIIYFALIQQADGMEERPEWLPSKLRTGVDAAH
jgi:hypothetical protein